MPYRDIAELVGTSLATVARIAKSNGLSKSVKKSKCNNTKNDGNKRSNTIEDNTLFQ